MSHKFSIAALGKCTVYRTTYLENVHANVRMLRVYSVREKEERDLITLR